MKKPEYQAPELVELGVLSVDTLASTSVDDCRLTIDDNGEENFSEETLRGS